MEPAGRITNQTYEVENDPQLKQELLNAQRRISPLSTIISSSRQEEGTIAKAHAHNLATAFLGESIAFEFVQSLIEDLNRYSNTLDDSGKHKFSQLVNVYQLLSLENKDHFATTHKSIAKLLIKFKPLIRKNRLLESFWIGSWDREAFLMLLGVHKYTEEGLLSPLTINKNELQHDLLVLLRILKNYHIFMKILLKNHPHDYRFRCEKIEGSVLLLSGLFNHLRAHGLEKRFSPDFAPHLTTLQAHLNDLRVQLHTLRNVDHAHTVLRTICWDELFEKLDINIKLDSYQECSLRLHTIQRVVWEQLHDDDLVKKILNYSPHSPILRYALRIIQECCTNFKKIPIASVEDFKKDPTPAITWISKETTSTSEELPKFKSTKEKLERLLLSFRWLMTKLPNLDTHEIKIVEDETERSTSDPEYLLRCIAKDWANQQKELIPFGRSINLVYQVKDTEQNVVGYFKTPKTSPEQPKMMHHTARMEKLVWDLAVFFGCEKFFTPTTITTIKTRSGQALTGSLQIAQTGEPLEKQLEKFSNETSDDFQDTLIEAIPVSVLLGPYDAHEQNILSPEKFHPKFFDNTRTLPHSNKVLSWGSKLLSPYRCALLALPGCFKPLSEKQKNKLKTWFENIQDKLVQLDNFFDQNNDLLKEFPPGWFNRDLTHRALKNRFEAAFKALNTGAPTLVDLVFSAHPYFKFFAILTLFRLTDPQNPHSPARLIDTLKNPTNHEIFCFQQELLSLTGSSCIDELIDTCTSRDVNLDPEHLFERCTMPDTPFLTLLDEVRKLYIESKKKSWEVTLSEKGHKLKRLLYWAAEIDTKELDPADDPITFFDQIHKDSQTLGIPFVLNWTKQKVEERITSWSNDSNAPNFLISGNLMTNSLMLYWFSKKDKKRAICQTPLKIIRRDLLCFEIDGTLKEMTLEDLKHLFEGR